MGRISEAVVRWMRNSQDPRDAPAAGTGDDAIAHPLYMLAQEGGYRALKLGIARLVRGGGLFQYKPTLLALQAEILWANGDHPGVRKIAGILASEHKSALGYFYLAQSHFIHGELAEAMAALRQLLAIDPNHTDGIYLLASCAVESGDTGRAWSALEAIALRVSRAKTWLVMANLVRNEQDFSRLLACHRRALQMKIIPSHGKDILDHLALGALRCGDYDKAKSIWREMILHLLAKPGKFGSRKRRKQDYSTGRAERALVDLRRTLDAAGIEMFLVSGTLLGCIREGRLLGHDKDIDVGIWSEVPADEIRSAVRKSGLFFFIPSRSPEMLRVRHVNGIPLDLFYHHRVPGDCWHGGVKIHWHNSPFDLEPRTFLGETFLIPTNHERYLEENYGDWITPKTDFDSSFDTPNAEVIQPEELVIHTFKMLVHFHLKGAATKVDYYLDKLETMGEGMLVAKCRDLRGVRQGTAPPKS